MAKCVNCGTWAGIGRNTHDYDCSAEGKAMPPVDPMVLQLRPHIIRAGVWAGISCALTLIVAGLIVGIVRAMFF